MDLPELIKGKHGYISAGYVQKMRNLDDDLLVKYSQKSEY